MELTGVTIECAAGPSDRIAERFSALLDLAAPAFENSHPRFGGRRGGHVVSRDREFPDPLR